MDRREALKSITLSTGVVISSGTFLSLLQSCREVDTINWTPAFFTKEEGIIVSEVSNIILPTTDIPGALDVGVPQFIDQLMARVMEAEDSDKFRKGLGVFSDQFEQEFGDRFHEGTQEDQKAFVEKTYSLSDEETQSVFELVREKVPPSGRESDYLLYSFLVTLRQLVIQSYFTSEKIGEEVLSYDPIPGRQEGCIPVESVGNVWSL